MALVDPDGTIHPLIEGDVSEGKVAQLRAGLPLISSSTSYSDHGADPGLMFPIRSWTHTARLQLNTVSCISALAVSRVCR